MLKKCLLILLLFYAISGVSSETYYLNDGNFSSSTPVTIGGSTYNVYVVIDTPGNYILNSTLDYDGSVIAIYVNNTENVIIDGNGNQIPANGGSYYPIYVYNSTNVTVENLDILGYSGYGIKYDYSNNGVISNCDITVANYAIYLYYSNYTEVSDNYLNVYMSGLNLFRSNYDTINNNTIYITSGVGMNLQGYSKYNNISNLTIQEGSSLASADTGITLGFFSDNNTFDHINSTVTSTALIFDNSNNNVIKNSILTASSTAVRFSETDTPLGASGSMGNSIYCSNLTATTNVIRYSVNSISNHIYANNIQGAIADSYSVSSFTSPSEMNYSYLGTEYTNYLGNYWYDYNETALGATNVNGIWNVPYAATASINDSYPLAGIVGLDILIGQTSEPESEDEEDDGLIHLTQDDFNNETGYTITKPGYYVLDENITNLSYGIWINSSNVTFDGRGFSLIGNYSSYIMPPGIMPTTGIVISQIDAESEFLENITIKNTAITGWFFGMGTSIEKGLKSACSEITVSNCSFSENSLDCMLQLTQDVNVTGCKFGSGVGLFINYGWDSAVSGCNFSCGQYGVQIYGQNNIVSNCAFNETKTDSSTGVQTGILLNGEYITVSGCNFSGSYEFVVESWGIEVEYLQNSIITGCNFNGISKGIYSTSDCDFENSTITYNEFNTTFTGLDIWGKNNGIYLNNFENNFENMGYYSAFKNYFHSPVLTYEYNGKTYTGRLGNYYGEELGTSYAGIFDKPYGLIPVFR